MGFMIPLSSHLCVFFTARNECLFGEGMYNTVNQRRRSSEVRGQRRDSLLFCIHDRFTNIDFKAVYANVGSLQKILLVHFQVVFRVS